MSTQKSLLTYESVKDSIKAIDTNINGITVPIGVSPFGTLEYAKLSNVWRDSNILVYGVPGSGKCKFVEFIVRSVIDIYGDGLKLSYIDGKDSEIKQWQATQKHGCRIPDPNFLKSCADTYELIGILKRIRKYVEDKQDDSKELIIFDEIAQMLNHCYTGISGDLRYILEEGPKVGVHSVMAQHTPRTVDFVVNDEYFGVVCATRTESNISQRLFGNSIATAVDRYGDVVYSYRDNQGKLRVPFVESFKSEE